MKDRIIIITALAILFLGMCVMENNAVSCRPAEPITGKASAIYMLAGEFRVVFANLLWIKAEQYHHEYVQRNLPWTHDKELMGLIDLITTLDPHFVEAYETGSYILADGYKDTHKAIKYLRQAINNNPKAWELYQIAAIMYTNRLKDPEHAIPYAKKTVELCNDNFYHRVAARSLKTIEKLAKNSQATRRR